MIVEEFPDRTIRIDGVEYLYFGGTNYLGMSTNEDFQNILFSSIKKWGTAYGSSRNANIKLSIYETAEKILAKKIDSEAAVVLSSGMLAGKLVVEYLSKNTDAIFHFPNIHSALKNELSLPIVEESRLNIKIFDTAISKITVLTDSFPSMQVEPIDLNILLEIPNTIEITLVIDESHSFGIYKNNWYDYLKRENIKIVKLGSLGKAFGLSGGFIAANTDLISQIKNQECFVGASCMNPAFLETFVNANKIYLAQKQKLEQNLNYLKLHITDSKKLTFNADYPLIYFDDDSLSEKLFENNIITTSFNYLNGARKLSRVVITANHTEDDLKKLLSILNLF